MGDREREQENIDKLAARKEYKEVIKAWVNYKVDWQSLYPNEKFPCSVDPRTGSNVCNPDPFSDLMHLDISVLMKHLERYCNMNDGCFRLLPVMCQSANLELCHLKVSLKE